MKELLQKIYEEILVYEEDIARENMEADEKIRKLFTPYIKQMPEEEAEKWNDLLAVAVLTAEKTGFKNGMSFAFRLFFSVLK